MKKNMYDCMSHHITSQLFSSLRNLIRKVICIDTGGYEFAVRVFGRNVFIFRNNIIMKFATEGHKSIKPPAINASMKKITGENIDSFRVIDSHIEGMKSLLENKDGICEAFGLWSDSGEPLAYMWLMYKGGNYGWWHFRNIDAWIFGVFVGENHRRKGLCTYMIHRVLNYLHSDKKIDEAYLTVRKGNHSAGNAYEKAGGKKITHKLTFRICRINIPFHGHTL